MYGGIKIEKSKKTDQRRNISGESASEPTLDIDVVTAYAAVAVAIVLQQLFLLLLPLLQVKNHNNRSSCLLTLTTAQTFLVGNHIEKQLQKQRYRTFRFSPETRYNESDRVSQQQTR